MWLVYFHNVLPGPLDPFDRQLSRLTVDEFAAQVRVLAERLRPLPLPELLARRAAGEDDPRAVAVTFDDGYRGVLAHAAPVLAAAGVPAAVFVVTETFERAPDALFHFEELEIAFRTTRAAELALVAGGEALRLSLATLEERVAGLLHIKRLLKLLPEGERRAAHAEALDRLGVPPAACRAAAAGDERYAVLGRGDLLRMLEEGWTVGSHTRTHRTLSRLDEAELRDEIHGAQSDLARHLGLAAEAPLAYPYGGPEQVGERARAEAAAAGHGAALATVPGRATPAADPFFLPRLEFHELLVGLERKGIP
jgi:peptidoglycan/xylan/chitin deacetylase (PgdA/CDA1 family)